MGDKGIVHGALDFAELEALALDPAEIIDFSVNSNPYGPSPLALAALAKVNIERYPDRECLELRRAILDYDIPTADLSLNQVLCGNGTAELIWAVARAFLRPGLKAAIAGPTFGEYRQASLIAGAEIVEFRAQTSELFNLNIPALLSWLEKERPGLLWLCNPNNPTGYLLAESQMRQLAGFCRENRITLVIDEAYQRFSNAAETFSALNLIDEDQPGLIVLRSLTKDYGLAGLRLGYAASSARLVTLISSQLPSWNVNTAAQVAGRAALQDQAHLEKTLTALKTERVDFFKALETAGLKIIPSATHFCLVEVGNARSDTRSDAREVRRQLLQKKLLVRDCTSFGLPGYIRVSTRLRPDWQILISELKTIISDLI